MGNSNTKEAPRSGDGGAQRAHRPSLAPALDAPSSSSQANDRPASRRNRSSRANFEGILGLGPSSSGTPPYERRETKQEREAKRLEKERVARLKERERSMREEHVDGGYLVTLGTYIGPEDFSKPVVRQLQLERKVAPFWRGLNDFNEQWAEHQIIAAARGLPIPAADQTPPEELVPRRAPLDSPAASTPNLNLMVPMGGRSLSMQSDHGGSGSNNNSTLPSPISPVPGRTNSPFKSRPKALAAALNIGSRNNSSTDIVPREINLPNDPFVNGQPIEVFLYKDASECPICFLYYPPYLNHTRCCGQPICSECFVQIKRPDPHYPEGHGENDPNHNPEETAGMLISEPACCPYCQQPDFGVTYEAPPFRRGLTYGISPATAMSSSTSLNSNMSPPVGSPTSGGIVTTRRRTESLSANAPNVILTDRVRPDWASKLNAARAHIARRAAAATALHTAAFLMGNQEGRNYRVARFSRRNTATASNTASGDGAGEAENTGNDSGTATPAQPAGIEGPRISSARPGAVVLPIGGLIGTSNRRNRMEDLEDMMLMEAIRLSLAAEEERKRKAEKEERKEAKKREKEERKAAKAALKAGGSSSGPYDNFGHGSANGSTLSLSGLGAIGRRRGNSGASNLRVEASVANAMATSASSAPVSPGAADSKDKGKGVDRGQTTQPERDTQAANSEPSANSSSSPVSVPTTATSQPRPIPSPHQPAGPSHLRQMSSASSVSSSLGPDSAPGSYTGQGNSHSYLHGDPRASALSLGGRSAVSEDGGDHDRDNDPSASTEPMFNFQSLAEMVGVEIEGENAGRRLSVVEAEKADKRKDGDEHSATTSPTKADGVEDETEPEEGIFDQRLEDISQSTLAEVEESVATLTPENARLGTKGELAYGKQGPGLRLPSDTSDKMAPREPGRSPPSSQSSTLTPPTLMITPETPAPTDDASGESKQLGYEGGGGVLARSREVTQ